MNKNILDGLVALKLVAEKQNFGAAAEILNISSPAVSQIVKQLEKRVGIALLTRTTRSVSLTEAGQRFLNQAGPAIEQILAAFTDVNTYAQIPSGLLRINSPKNVYWNYLSPLIASFKKKYPEITVEIFLEDLQSDVVKEGFDAGIRPEDILAKDMIAIKLYGPVRFVTAASPKYLNKAGRPKHPRDLLSHDCLRGRLGKYLYDKWDFENKGAEFQVQVKGSLILNDSLALLKAGADGFGVIYTDEKSVREYTGSGSFEIILDQFAAVSTGYYLYFPKVSQVQPKLRAFIDHIKYQIRTT